MSETVDESSDLGSMASVLGALAAAPSDLLAPGQVIDDQYRIERLLGHGAMGVVYLARDLPLERDVAIKLARERSPAALARSSREAVMLARLSHPNVVVIHQVGEVDGRVYVAMEYVAGQTARAWCAGSRSVREIVQLYLSVGAGLAAAHAAGLVHRDFKPDNVLVGEDGRARVADFGLARVSVEDGGGDVAGTPAYMAPEQRRGEDVDARADQFAFCTSLSEALHHTPRSIPRHIELAIRRGLAPDRANRWPTLVELLDELRRDPARRQRTIVLGVGGLLVVGVAVAVATRTSSTDEVVDPCAAGAARVAAVWTPARATRVQGAIAPVGAAGWIVQTAAATARDLDDFSTRWSTQYRAVCGNHAWSPQLRDTGMQCLASAEHDLDATIEVLGEPGLAADRVEPLLGRLPRPESCSDASYLDAIVPPPQDPELAKSVAEIQQELERARIVASAGKYDHADATLAGLTARSAKLDYPPLHAQLHHVSALVARYRGDDETAIRLLHDTYFEARTVGERLIAADAASEATLALLNLSRDTEAGEWAHLAEVEIAHIPDVVVQARTLRVLSVVATTRNDAQRGLELADRALLLSRKSSDPGIAQGVLQARSMAEDHLAKYEPALADLDEAIRLVRSVDGEVHPRLAIMNYERALIFDHMGRFAEAVSTARDALAVAEATSGPDSDTAVNASATLGAVLNHAGKLDEALALIDRALALDRKRYNDEGYNVASDHNNRCDLLTRLKRYDEALADCRIAIELWRKSIGNDANEIGIAEYNVANIFYDKGQLPDALAASDRGTAILAKQPTDPMLARVLIIRGAARPGDPVVARKDLEHAIDILGAPGVVDPINLGWAKLELARLDVVANRRAEASALATEAATLLGSDPRQLEATRLVERLAVKP